MLTTINRCLSLTLILIAILMFQGRAHAQPAACIIPPTGDASPYFLQTDPRCSSRLGEVSFNIDPFGSITQNACFDPAADAPDVGPVRTVYTSTMFICQSIDGNTRMSGFLADQADSRQHANGKITSEFSVGDIDFTAEYRLNCTQYEKCYTATNTSPRRMQSATLTHYLDGDLYFGEGGLSNDYGATTDGPRILWEFDHGDDPHAPTTYLGMSSLDNADRRLVDWEVGAFSNQVTRIKTATSCRPLVGTINKDLEPADTNGDGVTDEGFDVTLAMTYELGPLGPGEQSDELCVGLRWGRGAINDICSSDEFCDGVDNDCDGKIDENLSRDQLCATRQPGVCAAGRGFCSDGLVECVPDQSPTDEVCDGVDNDCDGIIDETVRNVCGGCGELTEELCNDIDDDCDGETDEEASCENGLTCYQGECRPNCAGNECPVIGLTCDPEVRLCLAACDFTECPAGQQCSAETGGCVDLCEDGPECQEGEICWQGECGPDDCTTTGCDDGLKCDGVECVPDPCGDVSCESGQFCRDGQCVPSCARVSCPLYESCQDGICTPDLCGGLSCPDGQRCAGGYCAPDSCIGVTCTAGLRCIDGVCELDGCARVECPFRERCAYINGTPQCVFNTDPNITQPSDAQDSSIEHVAPVTESDRQDDQGSRDLAPPRSAPPTETAEACHCDIDAAPSPWTLLMLLPALGLRVRRRQPPSRSGPCSRTSKR